MLPREKYKLKRRQRNALKALAIGLGVLSFVCVMLLILADSGEIPLGCPVTPGKQVDSHKNGQLHGPVIVSMTDQGVTLSRETFGKIGAREIPKFILKNKNGMQLELISYGATAVSLKIPDKSNQSSDVLLGFDTLREYRNNEIHPGGIVGRVANRIKGGKFLIDGILYNLEKNSGRNHLNGGSNGFDKKIWAAAPGSGRVTFYYTSPDGEGGYPGAVTSSVTYELSSDNDLKITFNATTTRATPVNLSFNGFFNLAGQGSLISDHTVQIYADAFTPVDSELIPLGIRRGVHGTDFNLLRPKRLGDLLNKPSLADYKGGFDNNWCIRGPTGLKRAARISHKASGRVLEVLTDQLGVHFYTGNFLGNIRGKDRVIYPKFGGFSLETQNYPDAINNQPNFPDPVLRPGSVYKHRVIYRFTNQHKTFAYKSSVN